MRRLLPALLLLCAACPKPDHDAGPCPIVDTVTRVDTVVRDSLIPGPLRVDTLWRDTLTDTLWRDTLRLPPLPPIHDTIHDTIPRSCPAPPHDSTPPDTLPPVVVDSIETPPVVAPSRGDSLVLASLFRGARASSPHYPHATFSYTDFYYSYHPTSGIDTLARRYDHVMSGPAGEWRRRNPDVRHIPYRLFWTVLIPAANQSDHTYADMQTWYAAHPQYTIETAFLHDSLSDSTHRKVTHLWDSNRWLTNPTDAGFRAWWHDALGALLASGENGVFFDEFGRGTMARAFTSLELDSLAYQRGMADALAHLHASYPDAEIIVNTSNYATPFDSAVIVAAGGAHLEMIDDPLSGTMSASLSWIERMRAAGARHLEVVATRQWTDPLPGGLTSGNDVSARGRLMLAAYTAYLLVRDSAGRVVTYNQDNAWQTDPVAHWLRVYEADLGQPIGPRAKLASGKDPTGLSYTVHQRRYTRALVLLRAVSGWDAQTYGDATAVPVALDGTYRVLRSDGSLSAPMDTVMLRTGEGAILIPVPASASDTTASAALVPGRFALAPDTLILADGDSVPVTVALWTQAGAPWPLDRPPLGLAITDGSNVAIALHLTPGSQRGWAVAMPDSALGLQARPREYRLVLSAGLVEWRYVGESTWRS